MSGKIKGITLTVGGDTKGLRKEISAVDKETSSLKKELKEVEKALKLDPKNTELLAQKQKLLADAINSTEDKLKEMKKAQEKADQAIKDGTEISEKQYRLLQREISNTEASLKDLKSESKKTNDALADVEKPKKSFNEIKTAALNATKGISVLVAAGAGIAKLGLDAAATADDINTLAKQTGLSTEQIQVFKYASDRIDVSLDTLTGSLAKLTKNMYSAQQGSKNQKEAFEALGVSITDNEGKLRNNQDVMNDAINALSKMENETQRDAYAMQLFGKSAQDLNPLILGGADALNIMAKEAKEAGIIIDGETLESINVLNDVVDKFKATSKGVFLNLGAEIAEYMLERVEFVESISNATSETTNLIDKIYSENAAWKEALATQQAKAEANVAEIDYTTRLYEELQTLVSETGNVNESNKNRVSYILNELSEAIGIELELVGNQIKGYGDLSASIDEMLAKKRAEIILASQEETYKKAIAEIDAKEAEQAEVRFQIIEKEIELDKLRASQKDTTNRANDAYNRNLGISIKNAEAELTKLETAYADNDAVINEYYEHITAYESNYAAVLSGNAESIRSVNNSVGESFRVAGEATEAELKKQVTTAALKYAEIQTKVDEGVKGVTQTMADEALVQYNNAVAEYEKIGKAIPDGMQVGIENGKPGLKTKIGNFVATVKSWFTNSEAFDTHSPSKWSEKIGRWVDEGLANGIFDNIKLVQTSFRELFSAVEEEHEDLTKEEEKYNSELERIRAEGTEDANKAYLENLKTLADEAKERRKVIRDTYQGMVEDVQKSIDDLDKDMKSYQKGLSSVDLTETKDETIMIFNGKEIKKSVTGLADLSQERKQLEQFLENILNLREIGIDDSMIEQIKSLGGEKGGVLAQALLDATPEQREQFLNDFEAIGKLSGQVTAEVYKEEMQGVADDTKALFEELNPDFLKIGEDWGTVLGEGLIAKLNSALQNIKNIMNSVDFNYNIPTNSYTSGIGSKSVIINTEINQNIGPYQAQTAFEVAEQTRRNMENLTNLAVLS